MVKKDLGKGKKACPECSEVIYSGSKKCPKCGHAFSGNARAKRTGTTTSTTNDPKKMLKRMKEMGGLESVKRQLHIVEKAEEQLKLLGGVDGAKEAVAFVEQLRDLLRQ